MAEQTIEEINEASTFVEQAMAELQHYDSAKQKEQVEKLQQLHADFFKVASTDAGMNVLNCIMDVCGFNQSNTVIKTDGDAAVTATIANDAQRNVWLQIRGVFIQNKEIKLLQNIEYLKYTEKE